MKIKNVSLALGFLFLGSVFIKQSVVAQSGKIGGINGARNNVVFVPLPSHISQEDVRQAGAALKGELYHYVQGWLTSQGMTPSVSNPLDLIVILTREGGIPILPDLEAAQTRLQAGSAQPSANELTFTFNSPDNPWTPDEVTHLTTQLAAYYPTAKTIYGSPAFNIAVNLRKDPTITYAGLYFPSLNEMVVQSDADQDVICHEMIHAFRDDDVLGLSSYEEGMTRAAEIEVFDQLPDYTHSFDENHGYNYDVYYDVLNRPEIGALNGNFFNETPNIFALLRYQLAGYAWWKAFLDNPLFFATFNQQLYAAIISDPSTQSSEPKLLDIAASVQSAVEGQPFRSWYEQQAALNVSPPTGYVLYNRINQFDVSYLFRDPASGAETMQPNATINWFAYDSDDTLLNSGSGVTNTNGFIPYAPFLPPGYTGRIKVLATVMSPSGLISNTTFRPAIDGTGVFGVVLGSNSGMVTITSLDSTTSPVSADVTAGAFFVPSLAPERGRFSATFEGTDGQSFSKQFNKDASNYYLLLPKLEPASVVSRKVHGAAGQFDIALPLTGNAGIECRSGGAAGSYTMVFTFANILTSAGVASVTSGEGAVSSGAIGADPHQYIANLTGVITAQYITVTLSNVRDATDNVGNISQSMGILVGDMNASGAVDTADVRQTKRQLGKPVTGANFRADIAADGVIKNRDVGLVKSNAGTVLP